MAGSDIHAPPPHRMPSTRRRPKPYRTPPGLRQAGPGLCTDNSPFPWQRDAGMSVHSPDTDAGSPGDACPRAPDPGRRRRCPSRGWDLRAAPPGRRTPGAPPPPWRPPRVTRVDPIPPFPGDRIVRIGSARDAVGVGADETVPAQTKTPGECLHSPGVPHLMVPGKGFEPLKAMPADLQSAPFGRSGNLACASGATETLLRTPHDSTNRQVTAMEFADVGQGARLTRGCPRPTAGRPTAGRTARPGSQRDGEPRPGRYPSRASA
jgi:hypothetical protein